MRIKFGLILTVTLTILASLALNSQVSAAGTATPTPTPTGTPAAKIFFTDDFSTRANRWTTFDLGKAKIDFDVTTSPATLLISAQPNNYALWTLPDNALQFDHFDMQAQLTFGTGGDDARAGMLLQYISEDDMTVMAVDRSGDVYLGHYYYGIWTDLIPPGKVDVDPTKPITVEALVLVDHTIRLSVNDQVAGGTALKNFKAASFGLFAMSGQSNGINVSFSKFVVSDVPTNG